MGVAMFAVFQREAKVLPFPAAEEIAQPKLRTDPELSLRILPEPLPLKRVGARLWASEKSWHMLSFHSAENLRVTWWPKSTEREYFRVETDKEELWIFRPKGEKGMKEIFLEGIFEKA